MSDKPKKSVVLLSGGVDSIVNLRAALDEAETADNVKTVTFDYGQTTFENEAAAAINATDTLGVDWDKIDLPFYTSILGHSQHLFGGFREPMDFIHQADIGADPEAVAAIASLLNESWVPGRNLVFLAVGAALVEAYEFDQVVIGINAQEAEAFSDNQQVFLDAVNAALIYSAWRTVKVRSYTEGLDKTEIIKVGRKIGAPLDHFFSCYKAAKDHRNCGRCQSCVRVKNALHAAGEWERLKWRFRE